MSRTPSPTRPGASLGPYSIAMEGSPNMGQFSMANILPALRTSPFAITMRIKPTTFAAYGGTIFAQFDIALNAKGISILFDPDGYIGFGMVRDLTADDAIYVFSRAKMAAASWQSLILQYDGSGLAAGLQIGIKGIVGENDVILDGLTGDCDTSEPAYFGCDPDISNFFRGKITRVRVHNKFFDRDEILRWHYTDVISNAVATLPMLNGSGRTITNTGSGGDATIFSPGVPNWSTDVPSISVVRTKSPARTNSPARTKSP